MATKYLKNEKLNLWRYGMNLEQMQRKYFGIKIKKHIKHHVSLHLLLVNSIQTFHFIAVYGMEWNGMRWVDECVSKV